MRRLLFLTLALVGFSFATWANNQPHKLYVKITDKEAPTVEFTLSFKDFKQIVGFNINELLEKYISNKEAQLIIEYQTPDHKEKNPDKEVIVISKTVKIECTYAQFIEMHGNQLKDMMKAMYE